MLQKRKVSNELETAIHFPYALKLDQPVEVVEQYWDDSTDYWKTDLVRYTGVVCGFTSPREPNPYEVNVLPDEAPEVDESLRKYLGSLPAYPRLVNCEPRLVQQAAQGELLVRLSVEPI